MARILAYPDELAIVSCSRKPNQGSRVFATSTTAVTTTTKATSDHTSSVPDKGVSSGEVEIEVVFDVGHNPAAIAALVERIKREYGVGHNSDPSSKLEGEKHWNVRMVYGVSRDKDAAACLAALLTVIPPQHIHFAQVHLQLYKHISIYTILIAFIYNIQCVYSRLVSAPCPQPSCRACSLRFRAPGTAVLTISRGVCKTQV